MTIQLPTTKSQKTLAWIHQKFLCIGPGGIGKSEFWAQGDNTLFLECEPGLNFLEVKKVAVRNWDDFLEVGVALSEAAAKNEFPYDTIVIDTVDKWIARAEEEVIARGRAKFKSVEINAIGDIPNGSGWFWLTELIETYLDKLTRFPAAIALIGHSDLKQIETPSEGKYHRSTITIGGKLGSMLLHWSDHTMNIESIKQGERLRRIVRTKPSQSREAKSRGGHVPDSWEWGDDMRANYAKLRNLFT